MLKCIKGNNCATDFKVGDFIRVKRFFLVGDYEFIGFSENFEHGHNSHHRGSIDKGCRLEIVKINGNYATVHLHRKATPYGALAAIGTILNLSFDELKEINTSE